MSSPRSVVLLARPTAILTTAALVAGLHFVLTSAANADPAGAGSATVTIPAAGSHTASPLTSITLRQTSPGQPVAVSGSVSGAHAGTTTALPGGQGLTFSPSAPFVAGETVTVQTPAVVSGSYTFQVGKPGKSPGVLSEGDEPKASAAGQKVAAEPSPEYAARADLNPPAVTINKAAIGTAPGLIIATPNAAPGTDPGVMIYDERGELAWFKPILDKVVGNAFVTTYGGQPALVWFEGTAPYGAGNYRGEWVIVNSAYQEVARIRMGNGYQADIHDFLITPQGTALMMAYNPLTCDGITPVDCPLGQTVLDGVVQEVDLATGVVLFEWHSLDHIPLADSYLSDTLPLRDYIHLNSIDLDDDGNLLISGRHTSALYKVNRTTGAVIWTFGGKNTDFTYANDLGFNGTVNDPGGPDYPHDFRNRAGANTYSYFDNGIRRGGNSRGAIVVLNPGAGTATYSTNLYRPADSNPDRGVFGPTQGRNQELPAGHNLVAWGGLGLVTEYDAANNPIFDATLEAGTYRQVRQIWTGTPAEAPIAKVTARSGSTVTAAATWNGDTRTVSWRLVAGASAASMTPVAGSTKAKTGFETVVSGATTAPYVAVQALDGGGNVLGQSGPTRGGGWFAESAAPSVNGTYKPVVGDFTGTRNDDIIYYAPGAGAEFIHISNGVGGFTSYGSPALNLTYTPLVGDFVGDDRDEVIWWRPGSSTATMWRFDRALRASAPAVQAATISVPTKVTTPLILDNRPSYGGGKDEILWYAAGSAPDRVDRFTWVTAKPLTTTSRAISISGTYKPVTGDFDGNGQGDVFWYAPGSGADSIWLTSGGPTGSTGQRSVAVSVSGTYAPLSGNFSGSDVQDEVLFYAAGSAADYVWSFSPSGAVTSRSATTNAGGTPYVMSGGQDYVMNWGGNSPSIWQIGDSLATNTPSGNASVPTGYLPLVGDFVGGGGTSSVVWYRSGSSPELLWTGR